MKLAIFGAAGRTGIPLVQQALEEGHEVVALVRTPSKLSIGNQRLTVVQGDVTHLADVERVVQGADAVLSVLGHVKGSEPDILTHAIRNIITAMDKYQVKRLVSLSGSSVQAQQDKPKLVNRLIKFYTQATTGSLLKDAEQQFMALQNSDVDWVVVRGPMLTEGPHTGTYRIGWTGVNTGIRVSRANVADFMLKQVTDRTYLRQAPLISD
jgi:putative NADH-flavin reductase